MGIRFYGYPATKRDRTRGIKVYVNIYGNEYEWFTVERAEAALKSLQKAILKARGEIIMDLKEHEEGE